MAVLTLQYFSSVVKHIFHRQTFCLQHRTMCVQLIVLLNFITRKRQTLKIEVISRAFFGANQIFLYTSAVTKVGLQGNAGKTKRKYDDTLVSRYQYAG
jgi:hypothetical protein